MRAPPWRCDSAKRREKLAAASPGNATPKRKLTQEEQDEEDEKALEEWCEKWCSRIIGIVAIGSMLWWLFAGITGGHSGRLCWLSRWTSRASYLSSLARPTASERRPQDSSPTAVRA